jgi:phosphatidylserine/phosphatidylglycerophosphate/cardiolipin synthase-like enzyme
MIRIASTKIAEDYSTEFEEMFTDHKFGPDVVENTPNPTVTLDGTRIDVYFSPDDGALNALIPLLNSARESLYFLAYSFTSNELGDIIRAKAKAGLTVEGVMETEQIASNKGTEYDPFKQAGLAVRKDGNEGQMHHKVFIVDGKIVAFGSYNFSQSAETRNDENLLIIYNEAIAQQFIQEFQRVWTQAQP